LYSPVAKVILISVDSQIFHYLLADAYSFSLK